VVDNNILVEVCDNGKGISEAQKERIFTPNFTTKSAGMGLGLAMAKNMVESCGGNIAFSSEEGIGTIFTVKFPIHDALKKVTE